MKVCWKTNLGSVDAGKLGLDFSKCLAGETTTVSQEAGEFAVRKGWATEVSSEKAPKLKAVPDVQMTEPKAPDIKANEPAAKSKGDIKSS